MRDSVTALGWGGISPTQQTGSRELCMDKFRERRVREMRKREPTVRGARLAAVCFFLLILKSSVIRMRGREHVA